MDEDSVVKAPVTRLRRRLSVEQSDDVKSPGPATPTKKRGGRLAAKPQLDLIEENAPTPGSATKRSTRKTSVKEITEAEEKAVTPSRRSTRIKSNTSIVSETTQTFDSPRAKRAAARRTSQIGSDSESSVTPVKTTRRTRKDSASSVEKLEVTLSSKPSNITEVIIEETESTKSDDTTKDSDKITETTPTRRSPRIKGKKQADKGLNERTELKNNVETEETKTSPSKNKLDDSKQQQISEPVLEVIESKKNLSPEKRKDTDSDSSFLLVQDIDKKPRKISSNLNKSTPSLDGNSFKSNRQRTKSWTVTSHTPVDEGVFYSDNESVKKKFNKKQACKESMNDSVHMGSGDHLINNSVNLKSTIESVHEKSQHNTSVHKNISSDSSFSTTKSRVSRGSLTPKKALYSSNNATLDDKISPQGNKENILTTKSKDDQNSNDTTKFFEKAPTAILQSTVFFEDSDTDSKGKNKDNKLDTEDQCVPVVDNKLVKEISENDKQTKNNTLHESADDGCEPMDVDETIPNNISITVFTENNLNLTSDDQMAKVQEKSITYSPQVDSSLSKSSNKSRRKSSLSISTQNLEKADNENKSTLILSQIKDISSTDHNTSRSPKASTELLSKSACSVNLVKDKALDIKNISQDYSTSTPLQQKKFQKLGMQINSSIIDSSTTENKKTKDKSKNDISRSTATTSDDDSEDEVDSSQPKNSLLDDEAEVASDDYESGDSQDEDEREYEKNNEIVEKGETLDSDDEVSNDTDYEKDYFVVSSDEEDNELLSGSGDDLSMSDNELTMSKKSKDKYNKRKVKDQKKASREMYEARHKVHSSSASLKSRKSKRQKMDSSDESSEEETIGPVKKNKLRLDSTQDESLNKSDDESEVETIAPVKRNKLRLDSTQDESLNKSKNLNDSKQKKKSNRKRLSESICDENANVEHEITVVDGNVAQNMDPLSAHIKLEPKTPMKDIDISTVQINDNIEEVCIENDVSVLKSTENVDPLEATMGEEDSSSMSENSEIMNNYDSVLKELNNEKPKTLKSLDMSLNLNKKTKQNKQPIIDQLNITNMKESKKKNAPIGNDVVDSAKSRKSPKKEDISANAFEESSSSDSIDLQLLFSEDSNDFDTSNKSKKNKQNADKTEEAEDFIPLKRTPGKINILSTEEQTKPVEQQQLNESIKNKKRKSRGQYEEPAENDAPSDNDIKIIIDTQGTHKKLDKSLNMSLNSSTKKDKKNNVTFNESELSMLNVSNNVGVMSEEVPYKNRKKNRKSSETHTEEELQQGINNDDAPEEMKTTSSKKKNRKSLETRVENEITQENNVRDQEVPEEVKTPSSKKKNRKSGTLTDEDLPQGTKIDEDVPVEAETPLSKKKNRKSSGTPIEEEIPQVIAHTENEDGPEEISFKSTKAKKNNRKLSETLENGLSKEHVANKSADTSFNLNITKKKKKSSESQNEYTPEKGNNGETSKNVSLLTESSKKKKKKLSVTLDTEDLGNSAETSISASLLTESAKKKKKKLSVTLDNEDLETNANAVEEISENSKKRKRKSSTNLDNVPLDGKTLQTLDDSMFSERQIKKRKISQSDNCVQVSEAADGSQRKKTKFHLTNSEEPEQYRESEQKKKNKKRKERDDDDDGDKVSKIFKEDTSQKVQISRLPASIINQLEDKPKKGVLESKKSSVISTTPFIVEDTRKRRNKPSMFLEESVYLNDTHIEKKRKPNMKKPKVLPFIPTAVTSGSGFTTNFKINVLPQEVQFVAQTKNAANFKNDYLYSKKIKRLGTYETLKKHRSVKLAKF